MHEEQKQQTGSEVNAIKLEENDILVGHGYHTAGSEHCFVT